MKLTRLVDQRKPATEFGSDEMSRGLSEQKCPGSQRKVVEGKCLLAKERNFFTRWCKFRLRQHDVAKGFVGGADQWKGGQFLNEERGSPGRRRPRVREEPR